MSLSQHIHLGVLLQLPIHGPRAAISKLKWQALAASTCLACHLDSCHPVLCQLLSM